MMQVKVFEDYDTLSRYAADIFLEQIEKKSDSVLGLATGGTPEGFYKHLIASYQDKKLDFSTLRTFNLDEYYPIKREHPQSYWTFMNDCLFAYVNIPTKNIHLPNGETTNVDAECNRYEEEIGLIGGVDIQILGIGENGHIGFNEPGASFDSRTRMVELTKNTIQANSRYFDSVEDVPRHAITMGIASIMQSKKIVILAAGVKKAEAVAKAVQGEITEELPASILQKHPDVTFLLDKEAASLLQS
ncbi:glucosamine-6-phosphate deaminase [Brevibacillus sp. VP]|nr:glucosamine-6-phosphate deaminase [Brevibacillus sp. VP]TPH14773.1 glucosamine-6-phosphate deaminase [Brevibacillus laterosporus]